MRRFRKEFGLKKARILRERLIPVSQGLKIGINRQPLLFDSFCTDIRQEAEKMENKYCQECGTKLEIEELDRTGA